MSRALRIDEAMHPLTLMVVGLYGRELPNVDGAPLRTMAPWKYGFKQGKSIVKISFTAPSRQHLECRGTRMSTASTPTSTRMCRIRVGARRRSGASGRGFFEQRQPTLMFNGYTEVASLYQGMDLRANY